MQVDNKYKHIFFDLDRTIWDFDKNSNRVLQDVYVNFKLANTIANDSDFITRYHEVNELLWSAYRDGKKTKKELRSTRFNETLKSFSIDDLTLSNTINDYYVSKSPLQTLLFPYSKEVLSYLSKKYKLHIITNGFEETQLIKLNNSEIAHFFEQVIFSERVGVRKPHPLIFKRALKAANAKSNNSIMIGDDWYADMYGAQRMKIDHIYFNPKKEPHQNKVMREISCLSELYQLL